MSMKKGLTNMDGVTLNEAKRVGLLNIGTKVLTIWDDSDKPIWAKVTGMYRGHRGLRLNVRMPDKTYEVVGDDQVIDIH